MSILSATELDLQSRFDAFHVARASSSLVAELYAAAMGDAYPREVAPFSSCDVGVLGAMVARLRLAPGQVLADVGCGTGGVGLWLARALAVSLVGVDISAAAVAVASRRRAAFAVADRAVFRTGTLEATGLPDGQAHGLVCVDALGFAADRDAALRELRRVLRPGGRAVLTRALSRRSSNWAERIGWAGFEVEHVDERPGEPGIWRRLYELWITHEGDLRRELGDAQAASMLAEAARILPTLDSRRAVLLTLRRPGAAQ